MKSGARDVVLIRLGTATRLEALVKSWHSEASGHSIGANSSRSRAQRTYDEASTRLRQAVWDPLIPHLGGAARIFVVPDGLINLVNFAALPRQGPPGPYFDRSWSGDSLPHCRARPPVQPALNPSSTAKGLLALGGVAFDE